MPRAASPRLALPLALLAAPLAGCTQETVIGHRSLLGGLPGAQSGTAALGARNARAPRPISEDQIERVAPDGSRQLLASNGRHLMIHIWNTLKDGDAKTFVDQVLSERTRAEFIDRGMDPSEAFRIIQEREADIQTLFARMPMGERTPGVMLEQLGAKSFRFRLTGAATRGLTWTGIDMTLEQGQYRLRWFVSEE